MRARRRWEELRARGQEVSLDDTLANLAEALGALVTVIAVIGIVPYISIQLKAVAVALGALVAEPQWTRDILTPSTGLDGLSLFVVLTMGIFAILFGTRHIDTTEHQDGMILAIAVESMIKLLAFVAV